MLQKVDLENWVTKEKAFYAEVAFDFEVETTIGWIELVACNYRSDYDLFESCKQKQRKI